MQAGSSVRSLRRFVGAAAAIAPRAIIETGVVALVLSATEGVGLLLLVPLLQLVGLDTGSGAMNRVAEICAAAFHAVGLQPTLGLVLLVYLATIAVQGFVQRREALVRTAVQEQVVSALRNRLYRAIAGAKWTYFARNRSSTYTHMLTSELDRVGAIAYFVIDLAVSSITVLVYVALAFRVSWSMTLLMLACTAGLALTMRRRLTASRSAGEAVSKAWERLHAGIADHLGSLKIAKSYGAEKRHADAFTALSNDLARVGRASIEAHVGFQQQLTLASAAMLAGIVYVSYTLLAASTAQLLLLLFLFSRLVPRLTSMYQRMQALATALPAFEAVSEAEQHALDAREPAVSHPRDIALAKRLVLDRVTFDYREDGRLPAVQDVSLEIAAGATTAIVGPSGAGKSTIADLLLGLLSPSSGRITVDGVALGPEHLDAWRAQIGYVTQDTFLFHATVRENLQWAQPDATEEEIWHALRRAAAADFVAALPQGLDTLVGDRGVLVSGGERQRLSLARALLRRPSLLILDEATSSLDSENESRIQSAIDDLHQRMTIVVITHRLSTIRNADLIHVVDGGRLAESGTWPALMAQRTGRFRELCAAQGIHEPASTERRFEVIRR